MEDTLIHQQQQQQTQASSQHQIIDSDTINDNSHQQSISEEFNNVSQKTVQGKVDEDEATVINIIQDTHENLEQIIEQHQIIDNLEANYCNMSEIDLAIEQMLIDSSVSDQYKKSLFFIQSDQEILFENMSQLERATSIATNQMIEMQSELETYKNMLSERETELKIMKRERDEYLTAKVEITLDYKKIKNEFEVYQKHFEALDEVNTSHQQQYQVMNSQQVHPVIDQQSKLSKLLPSLFGVGKKQPTQQDQQVTISLQNTASKPTNHHHQRNNSSLQLQMHPGIPHIASTQTTQLQQAIAPPKIVDEQFENEQKEVIQIMQDQIQVKIKELQSLQKVNDESNIELGRVKGMLAREKERSEDLSTDLEISNMRLKKTEEQLQQREKEVETLKSELQRVRTTSEQEIKKLKKAQQNSAGTNANMTTGGSNELMSARVGSQNMAYDPYSNRGGGQNLNQSVLVDYHNVLNSQRDTFKTRESVLKSSRQQNRGQDKSSNSKMHQQLKQDMNQSVMISSNLGMEMGMSSSQNNSKVIDLNSTYQVTSSYDNPFEQSTASSNRGYNNGAGGVSSSFFNSNVSGNGTGSGGPVRSRLFGQKSNQNSQNNTTTASIQNKATLNNSISNGINNLILGRKSNLNNM